jgi:hypothetical protein
VISVTCGLIEAKYVLVDAVATRGLSSSRPWPWPDSLEARE